MNDRLRAACAAALCPFHKLDALMEERCWLRYGVMPLLGGVLGIAVGMAVGAFVVVPLLERALG